MKQTVLFLAWQDPVKRLWYPVGKLTANVQDKSYSFQYVRGAQEASNVSNFQPIADFPNIGKRYVSNELFPFFENRILSRKRPDFPEYLRQMALEDSATFPEILAVGGGERATDTFQIFPKLKKTEDGKFCCRFFLHGWRYSNADAAKRIDSLKEKELLTVAIECKNPVTGLAMQIQTKDYYVLGWAPRYLVSDFMGVVISTEQKSSFKEDTFSVSVVKLNPAPAPLKQRVLLELRGEWPEKDPMASGQFEVI